MYLLVFASFFNVLCFNPGTNVKRTSPKKPIRDFFCTVRMISTVAFRFPRFVRDGLVESPRLNGFCNVSHVSRRRQSEKAFFDRTKMVAKLAERKVVHCVAAQNEKRRARTGLFFAIKTNSTDNRIPIGLQLIGFRSIN